MILSPEGQATQKGKAELEFFLKWKADIETTLFFKARKAENF